MTDEQILSGLCGSVDIRLRIGVFYQTSEYFERQQNSDIKPTLRRCFNELIDNGARHPTFINKLLRPLLRTLQQDLFRGLDEHWQLSNTTTSGIIPYSPGDLSTLRSAKNNSVEIKDLIQTNVMVPPGEVLAFLRFDIQTIRMPPLHYTPHIATGSLLCVLL